MFSYVLSKAVDLMFSVTRRLPLLFDVVMWFSCGPKRRASSFCAFLKGGWDCDVGGGRISVVRDISAYDRISMHLQRNLDMFLPQRKQSTYPWGEYSYQSLLLVRQSAGCHANPSATTKTITLHLPASARQWVTRFNTRRP